MTWVRIDDHFDEHPKIAALSDAAVAVFVAGLAYCNRNLTDGFIPSAIGLGKLRFCDGNPIPVLRELEASGMFEECEGGWHIHDYLDYQPTREQVLEERAASKVRMQKSRLWKRDRVHPVAPVAGVVTGMLRKKLQRKSDKSAVSFQGPVFSHVSDGQSVASVAGDVTAQQIPQHPEKDGTILDILNDCGELENHVSGDVAPVVTPMLRPKFARSSPAPVPVPVPVPIEERTKNRADAAAGASGDSSKGDNGKGTGKALKDVLDTPEFKARAELICAGIEKLPRKVVTFQPWQCLQKMVNGRLPVSIGLKILLEVRDRWEKIDHPWKYVQTVLDKEHMALHIRLVEAEHQKVKNQKPNLEALGAVFRRIEAQHPGTAQSVDPQPEEGGEAFS